MKRAEVVKNGSAVSPSRPATPGKKSLSPVPVTFAELVEDGSASLGKVINDPQNYEEIAQWTEANSSNLKRLMRRYEVVQWLYQNNRIDNKKWDFLINEIVSGGLHELLGLKTKFSIILWSKLCEYLSETPAELQKFSEISGFLSHASLEQRLMCFSEADQVMMATLFEHCSSAGPLRHCLYSVLCVAFSRIRNEEFFIKLLSSSPFFFEFALAASSPTVLSDFEREYQGKKWFNHYKNRKSTYSKCKAEVSAGDKIFKQKDLAGILRYLQSIVDDENESRFLSDDVIASYFRMNDPDICLALFANPILCGRLIELHEAQAIVMDIEDRIFPLMQWMMEKERESSGAPILRHLLKSEKMAHYFIGAVELLFTHYCQDDLDKQFLEQFFECFSSYFFSGVTIEQLKGLKSIRGSDEVILGGFARLCSDKADAYRVLGGVSEENILDRWKATSNDIPRFIEEFRYQNSSHVDRWMRLLSCEWKGDLNEKDIIDLIVKHCKQLCFAEFLQEIKGTRRIDQLFARTIKVDGKAQIYLAKRIVCVPNIFGRCAFSLKDFKSWKPILLLGALSQAAWHKSYGFKPLDFYQLIREDREGTLFSIDDKKEGYLDRLLTHSNLNSDDNRRARLFLVHILLNAPADVHRVVQDWLRRRVRKILLKAVDEKAKALGTEQDQLAGMMKNQAGLSATLKSLVTLNHYLVNSAVFRSEDFLEILHKDLSCKKLVAEILSQAPRCVQDLVCKGRSLEVAPAASKPWCAKGKPYRQFSFEEKFKPIKLELKSRSQLLNGKPDSAHKEDFVNLVWLRNCEFVLALLKDEDVKLTLLQVSKTFPEKGGEYLNQLLAIKEAHQVCGVLNTNPLARKVGLMMHPQWLETALCYLGEDELQLHPLIVSTYLQLPDFWPTTRELHPFHLISNGVAAVMTQLVDKRARQLVEYLIDLCHYDYKKLKCQKSSDSETIRMRATHLVDIGIESEFKKLPRDSQDQTEVLKMRGDRFVCLCVSASEFLSLEKWDGLFKRNETLLSHLCQSLVEYDLVTMSASEVPAFVRLLMIILRNLSQQLVLPRKPTDAQIQAKFAAQTSINHILWQLSCIPAAVPGKVKVQDCLDEESLRSMDELGARMHLVHVLTDTLESAASSQDSSRSASPNL